MSARAFSGKETTCTLCLPSGTSVPQFGYRWKGSQNTQGTYDRQAGKRAQLNAKSYFTHVQSRTQSPLTLQGRAHKFIS